MRILEENRNVAEESTLSILVAHRTLRERCLLKVNERTDLIQTDVGRRDRSR